MNRFNCNWLLNHLGYLDDLFNNSLNWDDLLDVNRNLLDDLFNCNCILSNHIINLLNHNLLFNHLHCHNLYHFFNLLNNLLNVDWNLNNFLDHSFSWNKLLLNLNNLSNLRNNMVNWLLNLNNFCLVDDSLHDFLDLDYLRNLVMNLNDFFPYHWHLNYFFREGWDLN